MMSTSVIVADDKAHIARLALDLLVSQLAMAVRVRGEAHLALTGGSSAEALYEALRSEPRARRVPWERVHVWLGDERIVPHDNEDSNWHPALEGWLEHPDGPSVPPEHRHPVPVEAADTHEQEGVAAAHAAIAARYAAEIERHLPRRGSLPAFDVVLLGVGSDGHILSVFPGSEALEGGGSHAIAVPAPTHIGPNQPRVTLAPRLLEAAGLIIVMVAGEAKRDIVADCLGPVEDPRRWPAQLARRPNAVWLVDRSAASRVLPRDG